MGLAVPGGVVVNRVDPDSPADRADLRIGDIILAVNGREVESPEALKFRVATLEIGSQSALTVRRDGRNVDLAFEVIAPPEEPPRETTRLRSRNPLQGAVVANLSPALIEEIGYDGSLRQGVVVLEVERGSAARRLRLQPGDVITRVNAIDIDGVRELQRAFEQNSASWTIAIRRGERTLETTVRG